MEKQIEFVTKGRTLARYIGPGGDVAIPDGVAVIGGTAFSYSLNVTGVTIPDGVCRIGTSAFFGCANLGRISIPDSVTEIHTGAFEGCSALEHVSVPASTRLIGDHAFYGCAGLESIVIPASVESIASHAWFAGTALNSADQAMASVMSTVLSRLNAFDILPLFSAGRSRKLTLVPIIQSLAQLEKNYGKEGAEIIQDNVQDTIFSWDIRQGCGNRAMGLITGGAHGIL